MFEDEYFLKETVININAAIVGIGKSRWAFIEESTADDHRAADIMRINRFDVLPIMSGSSVREYYQTDKWGDFSAVSKKLVTYADVVPMETHIREVIRGFATQDRHFYFLANDHRIVGLIAVVNLNCRQVRVYLFSLLSELETRLGKFVSDNVPEDELQSIRYGDEDKKIKDRYHDDRTNGVDLSFVEYLYLSNLSNVVTKKKLYKLLGYSGSKFKEDFGSINTIRNPVAHPIRSIITNITSVQDLWRRIDKIEDALFRLRSYESTV